MERHVIGNEQVASINSCLNRVAIKLLDVGNTSTYYVFDSTHVQERFTAHLIPKINQFAHKIESLIRVAKILGLDAGHEFRRKNGSRKRFHERCFATTLRSCDPKNGSTFIKAHLSKQTIG